MYNVRFVMDFGFRNTNLNNTDQGTDAIAQESSLHNK